MSLNRSRDRSRRFLLALSLLSVFALGALIVSCGGSNATNIGPMSCAGPAVDVVGDWTLTFTNGGVPVTGPGVINSSGLAVFFQTTTTVSAPGDTVVLPAISGANCFSGTGVSYGTAASGGGTASDTVQGTVNSTSSITGSITNGNTFSMASASPLTGPVAAPSGSMLAEIEGGATAAIWQLTFVPSGVGSSMSFSGTDGQSCSVSGSFNQEGGDLSTLNVFDTSMTFSGTCPDTGVDTVTGLGFESSSDYFDMNGNNGGTYLYSASSSSALVFEIYLEPELGIAPPASRAANHELAAAPWAGIF